MDADPTNDDEDDTTGADERYRGESVDFGKLISYDLFVNIIRIISR